ncbi:single-stranded DNA-binding protein [Comamonas thiooxydans]|uniref:single-stranded DNA-binding protein n=2 Tax=Comamonas thiooxydans TaxID=363952 RepID=UPI00311F86D0
MIKISVTSTDTRNMRGNGKASGKPYDLYFQTAYVHTFDRNGKLNPYPEKTEIILDKDEQGNPLVYPAGDYILAPSSIEVSRNGDITVRPRLVKPQATPKPAQV